MGAECFEHARRLAEADGMFAEEGEPTMVRIPARLLAAARARLGLEEATEIVTAALSHVVYGDDFGPYLLTLHGLVGPGYMRELDREREGDRAAARERMARLMEEYERGVENPIR